MNLDSPLVLVEGPFDYTSVYRAYPNVVASFTSGLSVEKCKRLGLASELITFYDHGSGGDAARKRLDEVFPKLPITHLIPTEQQEDPGNMSLEEIQELLTEYVPFEGQ